MKHTVRLQEEISKHVSARKHITTQIEYFCDSEEDTKHLTQNITEVLTKHLGDSRLAYTQWDSSEKEE